MTVDRDIALVGALYPEGELKMPWPALRVPPLHALRMGSWELERHIHPGWKVRGYFTPGYQQLDQNWTLKKGDTTTWMSITPMELESQAHHAVAARGRVLIGGLGMGVLAWNVAQKPEVEHVTIVERDPEVIELVRALALQNNWRNWFQRTTFVQADIFSLQLGTVFDVALLDIWPAVGHMELRDDLQRIARGISAQEYAAWGMEHDFLSWLMENKIPPRAIQSRHWRDYSNRIAVQLIMRGEPLMAQLAFQAVVNGMKHETDKLVGTWHP